MILSYSFTVIHSALVADTLTYKKDSIKALIKYNVQTSEKN